MHGHGLRHEGGAECLVVRIASGREHHAFSRLDHDLLSANDDARTGDGVAVAQDVCNRGLEQDRHLLLLQTVEQPCDQRVAHREAGAARISEAIDEIAREQLRRVDEIGRGPKPADQPRDVLLAHHHAAEHHEFRDWGPDPAEILAQEASVKWLRHDGAAAHRRARHVAAIVRVLAAGQKLHVGPRAQIVDRRRPGLKEGRAQGAVGRAWDQRVEIALRLTGAVVETGGLALGISGNPQRSGRSRSGTANLIGLLAQEHVEAFERSDQRRRHSGGPRAGNQEVNVPFGIHR